MSLNLTFYILKIRGRGLARKFGLSNPFPLPTTGNYFPDMKGQPWLLSLSEGQGTEGLVVEEVGVRDHPSGLPQQSRDGEHCTKYVLTVFTVNLVMNKYLNHIIHKVIFIYSTYFYLHYSIYGLRVFISHTGTSVLRNREPEVEGHLILPTGSRAFAPRMRKSQASKVLRGT